MVSVIGLGCNNFSRPGRATETLAGTKAVLDAAIDAGITLLDTAEMYGNPPTGSESLMGQALAGRRDRVFLATKFGHEAAVIPGAEKWGPLGGATYVKRACDASLQRLQTDWIDLYQQHTPDPAVPIEETLGALTELVTAGKVRFIGHSNFTAEQAANADAAAREHGLARFVSAQNEFSLLRREAEAELLPELERLGVGFLPFFPLFSGLLTGKFSRAARPGGTRLTDERPQLLDAADWDQLAAYQRVCDEIGAPMSQVSIAWLLTRPGLSSVIAGATRPEQIADNAAAGRLELTGETIAAIDALFAPQPT